MGPGLKRRTGFVKTYIVSVALSLRSAMNVAHWAWLQDRSASKRKRLTFSRQHVVVVGVHEHVTHDNHTFKKALFKLSKPQAQVAQARKPRTPCAFEAGPVQIHAKQQGFGCREAVSSVVSAWHLTGPQQAVEVAKEGPASLSGCPHRSTSVVTDSSVGHMCRLCW